MPRQSGPSVCGGVLAPVSVSGCKLGWVRSMRHSHLHDVIFFFIFFLFSLFRFGRFFFFFILLTVRFVWSPNGTRWIFLASKLYYFAHEQRQTDLKNVCQGNAVDGMRMKQLINITIMRIATATAVADAASVVHLFDSLHVALLVFERDFD